MTDMSYATSNLRTLAAIMTNNDGPISLVSICLEFSGREANDEAQLNYPCKVPLYLPTVHLSTTT